MANRNSKQSKSSGIPAVGYIRMSTDQQVDSPERQRTDVLALAKRLGYNIIKWYADHGLTGTESANRPEFQQLLADAKNGTFQAVLLSEQSRMSREDIFDAMQHWRAFRDAGVAIVTCQRGELKFDNLGGVITAIVDQYGAREESLRIADRVLSGKRLAIRNGSKQGGIPFGYDKLIIDPQGDEVRRVTALEKFRKPLGWTSRLVPAADTKAVEAIQFIFQELANGTSRNRVAKELNRRGYRTMHGGRFCATTVGRLAKNPVYVGDIVGGRKRRGKFASLYDEGGVTCENAHEPLVDRSLFEQVQRMLPGGQKASQNPVPGRYLLNGLVYTADGIRLSGMRCASGSPKNPPRLYYMVPVRLFDEYPEKNNWPSFRAAVIEAGVLTKLKQFLASERIRRSVTARIAKRTRTVKGKTQSLENRLAEIRSRIERGTANLALAEAEDVPGISRLLSQWREEAAEVKAKLERLTTPDQPTPEALETIRRYDELLENLEDADREKLAHAIRQTVKRITLQREIRTRKQSKHRVLLWTGIIELHDEFGDNVTIPLTDEDIPTPGRWWDVVHFARERDVVFVGDVAKFLGSRWGYASRCLDLGVLAGKLENLGHQKGWRAIK